MGPDLEKKSRSENIHAPAFSGQKMFKPGTNYLGDACDVETFPIEQTLLSSKKEDVEVNIIGCTDSAKALMVKDSCEDVTEGSSSFGDTGSGTENASSFSDTEVESRMRFDNVLSSMRDDLCEALQRRKRSMTTHWRRFIGPLMWRCKWIELQLKQLQSQELKYCKELAAYNYTKQLDFAHITLDGFDIKSVPISGRMHRNKVMKRNKRKRVEEECDIASYMSNHSLFSYYEKTGRTIDACLKVFHGVAIGGNNDDNQEFELNDMSSSIDYEKNDESLDDIIQKIEAVRSQVHDLKTRIDRVVSENPRKFCSVANLSMLGLSDGFNHSVLKSASLAGNALSRRERLSPIIETADGSELEDPWEDTKDGVLVQNQAAKEELHDFKNVRNHLVQKTNESVEENKSFFQVRVSEPDLATENAVHNVHFTLKSCSAMKSNVPRKKRKGRKKSGLKRWRQISSGEAESE